jgi:hypothetical protein
MKVITIKEFAQENNIVNYVKTVRTNTNGYCYVTFVNETNEATNVYLSRKLGEEISEGDSVVEMFKTHECAVFEVVNADGETRIKLGSRSESLRGSIEDLF